MGKVEIVQGFQDFVKELNEIPYDSPDYGLNPSKLYKLVGRIKRAIKKLFGDSSEHLTDLDRILTMYEALAEQLRRVDLRKVDPAAPTILIRDWREPFSEFARFF